MFKNIIGSSLALIGVGLFCCVGAFALACLLASLFSLLANVLAACLAGFVIVGCVVTVERLLMYLGIVEDPEA